MNPAAMRVSLWVLGTPLVLVAIGLFFQGLHGSPLLPALSRKLGRDVGQVGIGDVEEGWENTEEGDAGPALWGPRHERSEEDSDCDPSHFNNSDDLVQAEGGGGRKILRKKMRVERNRI